MGTWDIPLHLFSHLSTPHHTTSTTMPARDTGAKIGDKLDAVTKQSYHELGYKMGERVDQTLTELNEKLRDPTGKTPEDHFKDIYGASASLIGHTYDYAWSWVPFTKQRTRCDEAPVRQRSTLRRTQARLETEPRPRPALATTDPTSPSLLSCER